MKIRNGFVSNSSTSSFCIYGICATDLKDFKTPEYDEDGEAVDEDSTLDKLTAVDTRFEVHNMDDNRYYGISFTAIKDDETGAQFKQTVQDAITKVFGPNAKCGVQSEAWYNG
jgi:hypothetical protein